ncbi:hypothetical protein B2D07_19840 [Desulfococcus multivorans]|nr:hypothetical protein B2D07_19840 [Desulfococcus multivorans]
MRVKRELPVVQQATASFSFMVFYLLFMNPARIGTDLYTSNAASTQQRRLGGQAIFGRRPQPIAGKHFSGKFMVRVPPEVHRKLAIQAAESGVSLNRVASFKSSQ